MKVFKLTSLLLAIILLCGITSAGAVDALKVGDIIEFGSYPQSLVTDETVISALEAADGEWLSYRYYSGTGEEGDDYTLPGDWMEYKDVIYDSGRYRGVRFSLYRPLATEAPALAAPDETHDYMWMQQFLNGYFLNTTYWFRYEPVKWRVLDKEKGLVLSDHILDSQPIYNNISYQMRLCGNCNNYCYSSIREWLNNEFYNTAFSVGQQNRIITTDLDNRAFSEEYSEFDSETSSDKVFLLSYRDTMNAEYGFSSSAEPDNNRIACCSDYSKAQGCGTDEGNIWWLRTAGDHPLCVCVVCDGEVGEWGLSPITAYGIRPAICIDLDKYQLEDETTPTEPDTSETADEPTGSDNDENVCNYCGKPHSGVFGKIIAFFHRILYFFKNLI